MPVASPLRAMPEAALQAEILKLAELTHWLSYHTHDSRRSAAGFPDLVLAKPPRLVVWECKREGAKPSLEQRAWLEALQACGIEARVVWPSSWAYIEQTLTGQNTGESRQPVKADGFLG